MAQERTWRHFDTLQFETVFAARVPRAAKRGPFIWMFEAFAPMNLESLALCGGGPAGGAAVVGRGPRGQAYGRGGTMSPVHNKTFGLLGYGA